MANEPSVSTDMTEQELIRRKDFLEFREEDVGNLTSINELARRYADSVIEDFYKHLLSFEETGAFFRDPRVLQRVKSAQQEYFLRLTQGNYDLAYAQDRLKIGAIHERIDLPVKTYLGMYNYYLRAVASRLNEAYRGAPAAWSAFLSLMKLTFLDIGLAIDTYISSRERTIREQARLLDQTHDCIFVRDTNDVITFWNRGAEELYGWSAEEAVGKKSRDLLRTVVPEASAKALEVLLATDRWEGELIETRADGAEVVVSSRWSLRRDEQGRPAAVLVTKNDITARKHREQEIVALNRELVKRAEDLGAANDELRKARDRLEREVEQRTQQARLLDLTHDCIFVRDMKDVITYWNRGAEELYGWSAEEAVGKKSRDLLRTVVPEASAKALEVLLATDRWEGELIETRADGAEVVVSSRWSLRRDEQGRPAAVLVTKNDITARKHREQEIVALNRELVKRAEDLGAANKELESFAYSVSHDLRAPLRHVIGYAELLQKHAASSLDEKSQRYMKTILESAKRMGELIDDLLGFSRIGRADTNKTTVDLGQLVREVIAELRPQIGDRAIAWNVGALPACHGDRAMLKVALVNLISNAVKFSRHRARAEIAIGSTEGQHNQIEVFVRDNGAGFDMRHADKLFGVFQRLHLAEEFEGTGIGLATVQRIIHRHGGNIRAEAGVDQGATFYFSLPGA